MTSAKRTRVGLLMGLLVFFLSGAAAAAELVLTAPPRESVESGNKLYQSLAAHLSELLDTPVTYRHPRTWPNYSRGMRNGDYDIVFDGPQFVSWRMVNVGHAPLVKLPGSLVFHIVVKADDAEIGSVGDLVGDRVCGIAPPNLGTLTVIKQFPNPARQPLITPIKGGFKGVFKALMDGRCRGAVLRTQFYDKKLSDEQKAQVKVVITSKPVPNQAISVSPRVDSEARAKIIASLTSKNLPAVRGILNRFARQASAFVAANRAEFEGHNLLLEGVIWGW